MALVPSLNKPLMSARGPLKDAFEYGIHGLGGGAVVNVFDKEVLKGRMTAIGYTLPINLGTANVRFNLTDLAFVALVNGLKIPKGKGLFGLLAKVAIKKVAESRQWIDPPEWGYAASSQTGGAEAPMPMISTGGLAGR